MRDRGKGLLAVGLFALTLLAAGFGFRWWQADRQQWAASATAETAAGYVEYAEAIRQSAPLQWHLMRLVMPIEEQVQQRRREAEHYRSELRPLLLVRDRRQRMRADYDRSAAAMRVSAPVIQAMLAVIDAGIAEDRAIPLHVAVKSTVVAGEDVDLASALGTGATPEAFDVRSGCTLDLRKQAQPLEFESGVDGAYGVFVTYTLKESSYPLVLTESVAGQTQELSLRGLAATVELRVVTPAGTTVRDARQVSSEGFARALQERPDGVIGNGHLYAAMLKALAGNACLATSSMLGTRDVQAADAGRAGG